MLVSWFTGLTVHVPHVYGYISRDKEMIMLLSHLHILYILSSYHTATGFFKWKMLSSTVTVGIYKHAHFMAHQKKGEHF